MDVFGVTYCCHDYSAILCHHNWCLGSKLIFLVSFAFSGAINNLAHEDCKPCVNYCVLDRVPSQRYQTEMKSVEKYQRVIFAWVLVLIFLQWFLVFVQASLPFCNSWDGYENVEQKWVFSMCACKSVEVLKILWQRLLHISPRFFHTTSYLLEKVYFFPGQYCQSAVPTPEL